jgi:hypothetical protein
MVPEVDFSSLIILVDLSQCLYGVVFILALCTRELKAANVLDLLSIIIVPSIVCHARQHTILQMLALCSIHACMHVFAIHKYMRLESKQSIHIHLHDLSIT